MNLCDNVIVLYIFLILKIFIILIFPILIYFNRNRKNIKIFIIIEILLLLINLLFNIFNVNSCIYNSNPSGIKRVKLKNNISKYNNLHNSNDYYQDIYEVEPDNYYKTYKGSQFYYYNQNNKIIGSKKLTCSIYDDTYMNKYGSPITSVSMVVSTLFDRNISPIDIMDLYLEDETNNCSEEVNIKDVFDAIKNRYAGLEITEISSTDVASSIVDGGLVIAQIGAKASSNLTCGNNYIVIYNINLEGKYIIADPDDNSSEYVCSDTSLAYGNILKSNRTGSQWEPNIINGQTLHYYLIKRL